MQRPGLGSAFQQPGKEVGQYPRVESCPSLTPKLSLSCSRSCAQDPTQCPTCVCCPTDMANISLSRLVSSRPLIRPSPPKIPDRPALCRHILLDNQSLTRVETRIRARHPQGAAPQSLTQPSIRQDNVTEVWQPSTTRLARSSLVRAPRQLVAYRGRQRLESWWFASGAKWFATVQWRQSLHFQDHRRMALVDSGDAP